MPSGLRILRAPALEAAAGWRGARTVAANDDQTRVRPRISDKRRRCLAARSEWPDCREPGAVGFPAKHRNTRGRLRFECPRVPPRLAVTHSTSRSPTSHLLPPRVLVPSPQRLRRANPERICQSTPLNRLLSRSWRSLMAVVAEELSTTSGQSSVTRASRRSICQGACRRTWPASCHQSKPAKWNRQLARRAISGLTRHRTVDESHLDTQQPGI